MVYVIVTLATVFALWQIIQLFGVFDSNSGVRGLVTDINTKDKYSKRRAFARWYLGIYTKATDTFKGLVLPEDVEETLTFYISRLEIRNKTLNRPLTAKEVRGKDVIVALIGILFIPIGLVYPMCLLITVACLGYYFTHMSMLAKKVRDEDNIIDMYFINLYLVMYSVLRQGSKGRLLKIVESYTESLKTASDIKMRSVMEKFAKYLLNNLTMYEDDVAVYKLREQYKSATVVNFCNVAAQALGGVDNADALLSLKLDLVRKKSELMMANSEQLRLKCNRAIYLIWVILVVLILVGWYSKLPLGLIKNFIGGM